MPSVWLLLISSVFLPSPIWSSPPPCLWLPTWWDLSLILGEYPGHEVEWQWVHLPCGRTGWDPGFADDPVLPFSIKHDLCLRWMTLSFHGELGLACAWKMASLMGRTMGIGGKKFQKPEMMCALLWKYYPNSLSLFSIRISILCSANLERSLERRC